MAEESESPSSDDGTKRAMDHIERALRGLRFGEVTVIVQDGVIVQVERLERTRLQRGKAK